MNFIYTNRFKKDYRTLSPDLQKLLKDKLRLMQENPMHPSLRTKKIKGCKENIFECSINMGIRLTWQYFEQDILLRTVGEHDGTLKNP